MEKAFKLTLMMGLACSTLANAQNCDSLLVRLKAKYQKISSLQAHVVQTFCSAASGTCTRFEGQLELKRPNKIRMDIAKPGKQLIVCDGITVWQYTPAEKQVIKSGLKNSSQMLVWLTPLDNILLGRAIEGFPEGDEYMINMEVAGLNGTLKTAKIVVDLKGLMIVGIEAEDLKGNTAHYSFSKITINPGLKDSRFKFITPKNAEIKTDQ